MQNTLIGIETDWSLWWLKDLGEYIDITANYPDVLELLYDATGMYLFWRTRLALRNAEEHEVLSMLGDIRQGQNLMDIPVESLYQPWETLFKTMSSVLMNIQRYATIRSVELIYGERLAQAALVHFDEYATERLLYRI